jgi:malate dehydrogenase (oxaloacetate-decarboxylating)
MEGKAILFKEFGDVDAFPICLDTQDTEEIIHAIKLMAPTFGGINLEDITSPRCVEIETRLKEELDIPIFHDDQHGTAIVTLAALINSLKIIGKRKEDIRVVVSGVGAAGSAIIRTLKTYGVEHIIAVDRHGMLDKDNFDSYDFVKQEMFDYIETGKGTLADAMKNTDVFIGVSVAGLVTKEMVESMNQDPIILAMANPVPEIMPELAYEAGAAIVGTGRSDYPNQVNNVSAFPGIFRGTFDAKAHTITREMMVEAAYAIASYIPDEEINKENIIPSALNKEVSTLVAERVKAKAIEQGVIRK